MRFQVPGHPGQRVPQRSARIARPVQPVSTRGQVFDVLVGTVPASPVSHRFNRRQSGAQPLAAAPLRPRSKRNSHETPAEATARSA